MFRNVKFWLHIGFLGASLLLSPHQATAQLHVKLQSVTPSVNGHTFTYDLSLDSDSILMPGDYATIYDFNGLVPGANSQPANWTFSSPLKGKTPYRIRPNDNEDIPNLTWIYTGPPVGPGPIDLGLFSVDSIVGNSATAGMVSQAHLYAPGQAGDGQPIYMFSYAAKPHAAVASHRWWALLLPGLLPLGLGLRRLRRR